MNLLARLLPFQRARRLPKAGMVGLSVLSGMAHLSFSSDCTSSVSMSVAGMENGDVGFAAVQKSFARESKNG